MPQQIHIERINRRNFRSCLEALARPGELQPITPLFDSGLLALASVFLYAEVRYHYAGPLDFSLIEALTGSRQAPAGEADYLFGDANDVADLKRARTGSPESPEQGATLLYSCSLFNNEGTRVRLSGPGIENTTELTIPFGPAFIAARNEQTETFPMGIDLLLVSHDNELLGLPRTTQVEVLA